MRADGGIQDRELCAAMAKSNRERTAMMATAHQVMGASNVGTSLGFLPLREQPSYPQYPQYVEMEYLRSEKIAILAQ
jgi:hypothetical protein